MIKSHPIRVRLASVLSSICIEYGVSKAEIEGPSRERRLVVPRQIAYWLGKERIGYDIKRVALMLGDRDSATVAHGVRRCAEWRLNSKTVSDRIDKIWERAKEIEAKEVERGKRLVTIVGKDVMKVGITS